MFQRQTRQPFPARNIVVLAALALGFMLYLTQKVRQIPEQNLLEVKSEEEKRDSGLLPFEEFYAMREYPRFTPDIKTYSDAMKVARHANEVARQRGGNDGLLAPWKLQGPANIGARINTIAVHPNDKNTIYVGYSCGGAWKTTDGGQNWKPIFDDQNFSSIGHIAIDPDHSDIVFIGTGDPNISGYPFVGDGIWKSIDGGETWQPFGLENDRVVSKIVFNSGTPLKVYAATMGLPFARDNHRGLYYSSSLAPNWSQKLFVSDQAGFIDLVASPTNPQVLYAASWDRIRNNTESTAVGENARIWKTSDGGTNWTMLSNGLPMGEQSRIGLAVDPTDGNHIFATYANADLEFAGLYESTDGGASWVANAMIGLSLDFQSNFAWYFGQIRINKFNPQDIWMLGVSSYRSVDGGYTWFEAVSWQNNGVHPDHHDLVFVSESEYLLATDGGLYRSIDYGQTWNRADNIPTTQFYRVAYNPHNPSVYYGGAQDNGTLAGNQSTMESWEHLFGGDGFQAAFHPTDPNIYYFEFQNGGIRGTVDGSFFEDATFGIDPNDRRHWDMQYAISKHNPDLMFTGTYRLYLGVGHMPFWSPITDDLTDGVVYGARYHTISTLDESALDPDILYVGTNDGNVWRVNPNTLETNNISAGLPDRYVSSVKASPNTPDRVYVSHTGYRDNDNSPLIYRSDNKGATWAPVKGNLPDLAINDLCILPGHQDSVLFAATDGGVYATLNGGQSWDRLGEGMPFIPVYDLDINLSEKTLIAGTFARSIYSFPIDSLRIGENSSTFAPGGVAAPALTINPSPASDFSTLTLENLKSNQSAEVYIMDLAGKIIWKERYKGFGKHQHQFDLQGFAPGIYLAYARSNGKTWGTKKFVVAR